MKKLISVVIPAYNEQENIPELMKQLKKFIKSQPKYRFEVLIIENGSFDNSFNLLKKLAKKEKWLRVIRLSRNFGAENAIQAGFSLAKGDALVIMMADLQEPVEMVAEFLKKWEEGYDIVYGIIKKRAAGLIRNFSSRFFYQLLNNLTSNAFPKDVSDFRLIDKRVYQTVASMGEQHKYLRGIIAWTGFRQIGLPFDRRPRFAGKSKADFKTAFYTALNAIFSFSYLPLRAISILGFLITIGSFFLIAFYFSLYLIYGRVVPGITTVILLMLFLFGMLFFILGIISEYLARIYEEAKKRPIYIIKETIN